MCFYPSGLSAFGSYMKEKIILIGGGGHCRSCIDVIEQEGRFEIAGIMERPNNSKSSIVLGYAILGTDDDLSDLKERYDFQEPKATAQPS